MFLLGEVRVDGFHRIAAAALGTLLFAGAGTAEAQPGSTQASRPLVYSILFTPWVGVRQMHFDALNQALARCGFAPIPDIAPIGGLDLGMGFGRAHLTLDYSGGSWSTRRPSTGTPLPASTFAFRFLLSYDFIQRRRFSVFMTTGIGGGGLSLDARTPGLSLFRELRPSDGNNVDYSYTVVPLGIGADNFVELSHGSSGDDWVLQVGMRVAYVRAIKGGWHTDTAKQSRSLHGPPVDASGLRMRLVVGIGGRSGW